MTAGLKFSNTALWVGNAQFNIMNTSTVASTVNGAPPLLVSTFKDALSPSSVAEVTFSLKIDPLYVVRYTLYVSSADQNVAICGVS
jgi:hypothetical protein